MSKTAGIIGGGLIGGGWAARFALGGWDVKYFDPSPEAERRVNELLQNARRALPGLMDTAPPKEGSIERVQSVEEAASGAQWIQESAPERLETKREVYRKLEGHCDEGAVVASSTSGFRPSQLQEGSGIAERIIVAHPFNPVYLLPLVEVVTTKRNPETLAQGAEEILKDIGMRPLRVRAEIDAHIADRLMEALWREALWLVNDGVATTKEIDDSMCLGFGLRWAQMGVFETFRVAGGEAGFKSFLEQFGPALKWPWTKLMDTPDLDDALIERISSQSDSQSGHLSIAELERIRDANLVAIMRGLKASGWGVGKTLSDIDQARRSHDEPDLSGLALTADRAIPLDWTDYNGHMNEARYLQVFSEATDRVLEIIGAGPDYVAAGSSYFTAESHIRHVRECMAGERITVRTLFLDGAGSKLRIYHEMRNLEGDLVATGEHLLLHVSLETRKTTPPSQAVSDRLASIQSLHGKLPRPSGVGRSVGQPPPR